MSDETVRVFLVDDHEVVRSGLAAYLATEPGMAVVGQAGDGRRALDEFAVLDRAGDLPDVVLMDVLMPEMDGITGTAEIKRRWPEVEVVAVTSFLEEGKIRAVLEAGAAGYLLKDADADDVVHAIRAAQRGEVHLDPAAAKALTAAMRAPRRAAAAALTPREREVIVLIARGGTNRQIGKHLGVAGAAPHVRMCRTSCASSGWPAAPRRRCGRSTRAWSTWRRLAVPPSAARPVAALRSTSPLTARTEPARPTRGSIDAQLVDIFFDRVPMGVAVFAPGHPTGALQPDLGRFLRPLHRSQPRTTSRRAAPARTDPGQRGGDRPAAGDALPAGQSIRQAAHRLAIPGRSTTYWDVVFAPTFENGVVVGVRRHRHRCHRPGAGLRPPGAARPARSPGSPPG